MSRAEIQRLELHMSHLWESMSDARARGDWRTYWQLRRSWLAIGRLYSILIAQQREESSAQLSLLDGGAGRAHDRDAS